MRAKNIIAVFLTAILISFSHPVFASIEQQRQDFIAAEKAIQSGLDEQVRELLPGLESYPLYPYLVYEDLKKNISIQNENRILTFLDKYRSTPLEQRLRQDWLSFLADNNQWKRLVRDYQPQTSQTLQCSYARALIETDKKDQAWEEAQKLWLHGRSRPSACDPVFDAWRNEGKLTTELTWQRIDLSIDQGQHGLARYLKRYLPSEDKPLLDLWLEVINSPQRTLEINWPAQTHPMAEKILSQGMGRLLREDTPEAMHQWQRLQAEQDLTAMNTDSISREIALYLSLRKHPEALDYFELIPEKIMTPRLKEWYVRSALFAQNWELAMKAWEMLDESQQQSPRWAYWKGRILEEKGRIQEATASYLSIANRQNYFSMLAADRISQPFRLDYSAINAHGSEIIQLRSDPGIMRAIELFYLSRIIDARREWIFALRGKNSQQMKAAAIIAHDMGWQDRAIIAAANAGEFDDLTIRFPLSYSDYITRYSRLRNLEPSWVFALARQESMFMADVGSSAGALGVMQIMPATGRLISSKLGERFTSQYALLCPETSIRFGTYYLKMRKDELQNNPVLATAAYNAGAHRVKAWLPDNGTIAADIWVENIPFNETRDYIEKVFTYIYIYEERLGLEPGRISALMPDIQGKNIVSARFEE